MFIKVRSLMQVNTIAAKPEGQGAATAKHTPEGKTISLFVTFKALKNAL